MRVRNFQAACNRFLAVSSFNRRRGAQCHLIMRGIMTAKWYNFRAMRYAVWNNKGGVGKSFLSFILGTEVAHRNPDHHVILVDMCPQANLSEIVLGGNGLGAAKLQSLLISKDRRTVGGYFDSRIASPHKQTGSE